VYVILFYCLGSCAALAVEMMARVQPLVAQWWWAVLAGEVVVYALTLLIPPLGRFHVGRALMRVISGVALRFLIAFTCGLFLFIGGEQPDLVMAARLFWVARWPSAVSSVATVALATYVLRVLAVRRAQASAAPAPSQAAPRRMTRDELLRELMSSEPAAEATQPLLTTRPVAPTTVAEPEPSLPLAEPPPSVAIAEPMAPSVQPVAPPVEAEAVGPPPVASPEPVIEGLVPESVVLPEVTREAEPPPEVPTPLPLVGLPPPPEPARPAPSPVVAPEERPVAPEPEIPPAAPFPLPPAPVPAVVGPVTSAAEAPPAEPAPEAGEEVLADAIRLPAEAVLRGLPPVLLAVPVEEAVARMPDGTFSFPWDSIAPQLAVGEVRIPAHDLLRQFPPGVLAGTPGQFIASLPKDGVALPLAEIVSRMPPHFFAPPSDQAEAGLPPDESVIFQEATPTGVTPGAARWTPPVAPPPAPAPPPVEPAPIVPESRWVEALPISPSEPLLVVEVAAPPPSIGEEAVAEAEEPPTEPARAPATSSLPLWTEPAPKAESVPVETPAGDLAPPIAEPRAATPVEPVSALVSEPAVAPPPAAEPVPRPEPIRVVEPVPEEVTPLPAVEAAAVPVEEGAASVVAPTTAELPAGLAASLLTELRSLDCRNVDVASRPGLTIVVAHTSFSPSPDLAQGFAELVTRSRELTRQGGAGDLGTTLVIGAQSAAFVGAAEGTAGVYLGVETDRAGAGQAAVAARKALPLLGSVPAPTTPAAVEPPAALQRAAPDPALTGLVARAITAAKTTAFRSRDGLGLALVGVTPEESGDLAAAALAVWAAAKRAHPSGVDKILVLGSDRTLGMACAQRAATLVVAGFPPAISTGLVGTEIGRLAKVCDEAAATGGVAGNVV